MQRRQFISSLGLGAASVALGGLLSRCGAAPKPNFIFILIDDMGWRDAGFMGSKYYETPAIDKLASQSMVFQSAYACGPNCAPSRASLLTGQYTPRHGIFTVDSSMRAGNEKANLIVPETKTELPGSFVTFAEALKPAGYVSASIGKWHLGNDPKLGPCGQGFDLNIGGCSSGSPNSYFSPYRGTTVSKGADGEYLTDRLTDEAVKFITTNRDKPFFLYLPHYAVHTPLEAKQNLIAKFDKKVKDGQQKDATYAAMLACLDEGVGRLLAALDDLKLSDNTIVIFTSDNGGSSKSTSNLPLRGAKGMLFEGGIRVPLCVRWSGKIKPGSSDVPVTGVDFYPTFLELAGAPRPKDSLLDGESLVPLLTGGASKLKRKEIFWYFPCYLDTRTTPCAAVRQGDWKLLHFFETQDSMLFNLKDDIGEKKDCAAANGIKQKELLATLLRWMQEVGAPVPKPA
jgi:arylsulfatase A-like enzyme